MKQPRLARPLPGDEFGYARLNALGSVAPYGLYLVPDDLRKRTLDTTRFKRFAESVDAADAVNAFARINVALEAGGMDDPNFQRGLLREFLAPREADEALSLPRFRHNQFLWMCPLQCRLLISLLIRHGESGCGGSLSDRKLRRLAGDALLSSPEVLPPKLTQYDVTGPLRRLPVELALVHEGYRSDQRGFEQVSVKGYVLDQLLQQTGIEEEIAKDLGFSPTQFQVALTALWAHFARHTPQHAMQTTSSSIGFEYMMGQSRVPKAVGDYILRNFCVDLGALPLARHDESLVDLGYLAERPFGVYNGLIICLDLDFALARMGRELWNLASKVAKDKRVSAFHADAGYAFEAYCERLLSKVAEAREPKGASLRSDKMLQKAPVDFLYIEGSEAVAFECKTAPLPASVAYGTDAEALAGAIRDKFVTGTPKDKQGFIQLANHIRTMLADQEVYGLEGVTRITPCLVVMEDVLTNAPAYDFAVHEARQLFAEFGDYVGEPVIIHAEDLALVASRAKLASPCEILLTLGRLDLFEHGTTKNAILAKYPQTALKKVGDVEIGRPLHFLDDSIRHLEGGYAEPPSSPCPGRGENRVVVPSRSGVAN